MTTEKRTKPARVAGVAVAIVLGAGALAWATPSSAPLAFLPSSPDAPVRVFEDGSWRLTGCIPGALCEEEIAR